MNIRQKFGNYMRAGYSGLWISSYEERRVEAELGAVARDIGFQLYVWSVTDSLMGPMGEVNSKGNPVPPNIFTTDEGEPLNPIQVLDYMIPPKKEGHNKPMVPEKSIILVKDFHLFLADSNPLMIRKVKDALESGRSTNRRLVVLGYALKLCPELEKEFTIVPFELPDREQLGVILGEIAESAGIPLNGNKDPIIDAATGMTTTEAADAFALAVVESGKTDIPATVVGREKASTVKKSGLLEVVNSKITLNDIGGLEVLKQELWENRECFTQEAKAYGLPTPVPLLVCGNPGTGKTLTASAAGNIFNVPLLRLEAGKLFGSLVGQSEQNWRTAFATMKAVAPACVHVDEIDGLFAGAASSGQTDGGTTTRVIKAILQDLQENADGLFFIFTANDIDALPDPLIDRCDVWSVDLPNQVEREAIWTIHIAKKGRKPKDYSISTIAKITEGFSGRQIEQCWLAAMKKAYNDGKREPTNDDVTEVAGRFVPTSKTMATQIEARRKRLEGRAKPAGLAQETNLERKAKRKISA